MITLSGEVITPSVELLKEVRLLQVFDDSELNALLQTGKLVRAEAYSNIVIEGELSWGLYLILQGTVGIFKKNKVSGTAHDVGQLKAGTFFGEMSLADENPRSATVRALTDVQLFHISKDDFRRFLDCSGERKYRFYESCVRTLVARLRELDEDYVVSQYQLWKTALEKRTA